MILFEYHVVVRLEVRDNRRSNDELTIQRHNDNIGHKTDIEHKKKQKNTTQIRARKNMSNTEEMK